MFNLANLYISVKIRYNGIDMIDVTSPAATQIRKLLEKNHCEGGMRLGVIGGGCSGLSYKFKLEPKARSTDQIFEHDGVQVFVDPKSYEYLKGMTLDYTETLSKTASTATPASSSRSRNGMPSLS